MTRHTAIALGLLSFTSAIARPSPAIAQEAHAPAATATAGHAPAEAGHGQPDILAPEAPLAIWTVIVFGVLAALLARYAWKPMMKALHDREEHMEHCLSEAERARNEAERLMAENKKDFDQAADKVRAMLDEAKKEAQAIGDGIVRKAQAEAEASRERAEREIGVARDQAMHEIQSRTADLAVAVAGKVLARSLSDDDQRRMIDAAMAELPALANGKGAGR